jgi:hypothetical protein
LGLSGDWNPVVNVWRVEDLVAGALYVDGIAPLPKELPRQTVSNNVELRSVLEAFVCQEPRIVGIEISDNEHIQIGVGGSWACVQHVIDEPWKAQVALPRQECAGRPMAVSFVCGGQDTEVPAQFLMRPCEMIDLVVAFFPRWQMARDNGMGVDVVNALRDVTAILTTLFHAGH